MPLPNQYISLALSNARRYANGGMVEDDVIEQETPPQLTTAPPLKPVTPPPAPPPEPELPPSRSAELMEQNPYPLGSQKWQQHQNAIPNPYPPNSEEWVWYEDQRYRPPPKETPSMKEIVTTPEGRSAFGTAAAKWADFIPRSDYPSDQGEPQEMPQLDWMGSGPTSKSIPQKFPFQSALVDPVIEMVKGPSEAMAGRMTREDMAEWGIGTALNLIGTSLPFRMRSKGDIGVFGGRGSYLADHEALARAEKMEAQGADRDKIWKEAGWGRDASGEWMYHQTMENAKINPKLPQHPIHQDSLWIPDGKAVPLDRFLLDPDLYKAYPFLKDYTVAGIDALREGQPGIQAVFYPNRKKIAVSPQPPERMREILIHEVNHIIQDKEGFSSGGDPASFLPAHYQELAASLDKQGRKLNKYLKSLGVPHQTAWNTMYKAVHDTGPLTNAESAIVQTVLEGGKYADLADFMQKTRTQWQLQDVAVHNYRRMAGEVASRNAESRSLMTPEESRMVAPWESQNIMRDYPTAWESQIHHPNARTARFSYDPKAAGIGHNKGPSLEPPPPTYSISKQGLYSRAEKIASEGPAKAQPDEWLSILKNKGLKADEEKYIPIHNWLKQQKGPISKEDMQGFIRDNKIKLSEHIADDASVSARDAEGNYTGDISYPEDYGQSTRFSEWQMGGKKTDYKELKITWDPPPNSLSEYMDLQNQATQRGDLAEADRLHKEALRRNNAGELSYAREREPFFHIHHEGIPDIVAHTRFNTRMLPNFFGKVRKLIKTLFNEEFQSDLHQKGREQGYGNQLKTFGEFAAEFRESWPGVNIEDKTMRANYQLYLKRERAKGDVIPDTPFKGNAWKELAVNRMLRYAVENGYDQFAWTAGDVQVARYDLSKQIDTLQTSINRKGLTNNIETDTVTLYAWKRGNPVISGHDVRMKDLPDHVGKEMADKIIKQEPVVKNYSGIDLKVGGEGHKKFYDEHIVNIVNKILKKFGVRAQRKTINTPEEAGGYHVVSALEGAPEDAVGNHWIVVRDSDGQWMQEFRNRDEADNHADMLHETTKGKSVNKKSDIWVVPLTREFKGHVMKYGLPYKRGGKVMPLIKSGSKSAISKNISEFHTGDTYASTKAKFGKAKADKQAIAVALSTARRANKAAGGGNLYGNLVVRGSSINLHRQGMIKSTVPGRTDKLPMNVKSGAYILPADIPSALGQGNTMAGGEVLKNMFTSGPYGLTPMKSRGRPRQAAFPMRLRADGGEVTEEPMGAPEEQQPTDEGGHIPIVAAGGEYVIDPEVVRDLGHGSISAGHRVLDKFVLHVRKETIKTLKGLPGPKK